MDSIKIGDYTPFVQVTTWLEPLIGQTIMIQKGGRHTHTRGRIRAELVRVEQVTATSAHGFPRVVVKSRFSVDKEIFVSMDEIAEITRV
jgi:hypothetical protein